MFLTELVNFYERKVAEPESDMPAIGYSKEKIGCVIRISSEGEYRSYLSLFEKGKIPIQMNVPATVKRTSGISPNFLWDKTDYVLGVGDKKAEKETNEKYQKRLEKIKKRHEAFKKRHQEIADKTGNKNLKAISHFLKQWSPEKFYLDWPNHEVINGTNIVFQIEDQNGCANRYAHELPDVMEIWQQILNEQQEEVTETGVCLITGQTAQLARIHPGIRGLIGVQQGEAALVSFNQDAFTSYGKDQSYNAPVSVWAARAYTTALNWLLNPNNKHFCLIGDTTILFWADQNAIKEEEGLRSTFQPPNMGGEKQEEQTDSLNIVDLQGAFLGIRDGWPVEKTLKKFGLNPDVNFFILGLSPNSARISVRFWQTATFGELAKRISLYYSELRIKKNFPNEPECPSFWQILNNVFGRYRGSPKKFERPKSVPPTIANALIGSVLSNRLYPMSIYSAVLRAIRLDQSVSYLRASILKACLIRNFKREFDMSLDTERNDIPYLLGRLFSLLEKNQRDALGSNVNATIRDRYIASASATPRRVFPLLLRLTQHHISKSDYESFKQNDIAKIINEISDFPATLTMEEQGVFFLGYYQQNIDNFTKKDKGVES